METLREFKNFVDEINLDNSRNYKISVLEKYKNNDSVKYFLHYLYSPYITTGISDKKINRLKSVKLVDLHFSNSVKSLLDYIAAHNTGTDEILNYIECVKFVENIEPDLEDLLDKIITKNLILGIEAKTINKAFGERLIEEFNVQLAEKYFSAPERIEGKEFAITTKIDGCRIIAIKENGSVKFYTRQGQLYEGLVDLAKEMSERMPDCVLDGELTLLDKGNLDSGDQYKATTKLCRTKDAEKHGLKMLVFDCLSVDEFKAQDCKTVYVDRRKKLDNIFANNNFTYFSLLPILYQGSDTKMITKILDEQVSNGEEGVMLNQLDATYQFKRCWGIQKCKKFQDTEVEIVGFEAGINKLANTLGTLVCEYKGNRLGVGSGFTDEERNYIWNHKEEYLGKLAKVKFFEETVNADGTKSLRFPIWLGLRLEEDC